MNRARLLGPLAAAAGVVLVTALGFRRATRAPLPRVPLTNLAAYIPAQCYAETQVPIEGSHHEHGGGAGKMRTRNGCATCHHESVAPNYANDEDVQTTLSFARVATKNRWSNVLSKPTETTAALSDDALVAWVRTSNYLQKGEIPLAARLAEAPAAWDVDGDATWGGFVPDCHFAFDDDGFDHDANGKKSGWRAFAYAPMPGMFWPTNGSAGDALVRLPLAYRTDVEGHASDSIYKLNLAILEAYTRRTNVTIASTDEQPLGQDLDGDGVLGTATQIAFVWPPPRDPKASRVRYVGAAAKLEASVDTTPAAGLFPKGTEFLHSLRYLDIDAGHARMAPRMKELRYMRKARFMTYSDLELTAEREAREKTRSPDKLRWVNGDAEHGVQTGTGWTMQGFIEDAEGELRPQSLEETAACIGCHSGIGATTDSTFSFARKLGDGAFKSGWYHWAERGLAGIPEPKRPSGEGEYAKYLTDVGGADDFGANDEARARFFTKSGALDPAMRDALSRDISVLLVPSAKRALALNRAYLDIVHAQSFVHGRDAVVGDKPLVAMDVVQDAPTGIALHL